MIEIDRFLTIRGNDGMVPELQKFVDPDLMSILGGRSWQGTPRSLDYMISECESLAAQVLRA